MCIVCDVVLYASYMLGFLKERHHYCREIFKYPTVAPKLTQGPLDLAAWSPHYFPT